MRAKHLLPLVWLLLPALAAAQALPALTSTPTAGGGTQWSLSIQTLFVVWKKVSCCKDIPEAPAAAIELEALQLACKAVTVGDK